MDAEPTFDFTQIFLKATREQLIDQSWTRLRTCAQALSDEQIWWRPNPSSNSIGNLMLHLNGNVTQWLIVSFTHADDQRDRPAEFSCTEGLTQAELIERLANTMERLSAILSHLTEKDLRARFSIQGYNVTGMEAIYHVVEHFALHYGQIAYITKMLRDQDLGFYRELNATGRMPPGAPARP